MTLYFFYRNGHGAVNCNTMSAGYNAAVAYGGTSGKGSYGCPVGFVGVGTKLCFKFPMQEPALFSEMADACKALDAVPYAPISIVQNVIVKALSQITVSFVRRV